MSKESKQVAKNLLHHLQTYDWANLIRAAVYFAAVALLGKLFGIW